LKRKLSIIEDEPTYFSLFDFPSHEGKDEKHIDHDFYYDVSHFYRWREFDICPKSDEKVFDTFEDVNNCAFNSVSGQNGLGDLGFNATERKNLTRSAQIEGMRCP
jgi:hypothetical protein